MSEALQAALHQLERTPNDVGLAAQLIDLSATERNVDAAQEALAVIAQAHRDQQSENLGLSYMLGTAQSTVARLHSKDLTPAWAEATRELRLRSRANLFAATRSSDMRLATMAWTNLGHALSNSARLAESYDCYAQAYEGGGRHPVGAGWMAVTLASYNEQAANPEPEIVALAHHLALIAQEDDGQVEDVALAGVATTFAALPTERAADFRVLAVPSPDSYEAFIRDNRLYLTAAVDGAPIERWDTGNAMPLHEPGGSLEKGPPSIVGMVNILKADYLEARRIAYSAFTDPGGDAHLFTDTGDGARYGSEPARYRLALRSALDCLDRLASAINSFWSMGVPAHRVHFHSLFRDEGALRPALQAEFDAGNWAMVALVDLADDLHSTESWLFAYRDWRNAATHKFLRTVPGARITDRAGLLSDISFNDLAAGTLGALGIARSALLTLFGAIRQSSDRAARSATEGGVTWGAGTIDSGRVQTGVDPTL